MFDLLSQTAFVFLYIINMQSSLQISPYIPEGDRDVTQHVLVGHTRADCHAASVAYRRLLAAQMETKRCAINIQSLESILI